MTAVLEERNGLETTSAIHRNTSATIPALTSIRFLGALMVLSQHFNLVVAIPTIPSADIVDAFFCLSGFILTYQQKTFGNTKQLLKYCIGRVSRVVPVYWFCIALAIAINPLDVAASSRREFLEILAANILLVQSWIPSPIFHWGFDPPAYTLSIEVFLYAFLPLVLWGAWKNRWRRITVGLIFSIAVLKCCALNHTEFALVFLPVARLWVFLVGVAAALLFDQLSVRLTKLSFWQFSIIEVVLAVGVIASSYASEYFLQKTIWLTSFPSLLVILACRGGILTKILSHRLLVTLGASSYALYLLHGVLIKFLMANRIDIAEMGQATAFTAFTLACILTAYAVYRWIEEPWRIHLRDFGNQLLSVRSGPRANNWPVRSSLSLVCRSLILLICIWGCLQGAAAFGLLRDQMKSSQLVPDPNLQNVVFDKSAKLTRLYAWKKGEDLEIFTCWRPEQHPERAPKMGVHILDKQHKIMYQSEHLFSRTAGIMQLPWRDRFIVPARYLKQGEEVGIMLYNNPQQTLLIQSGRCDWGNHRLLFKLPGPTDETNATTDSASIQSR